MKKRDEVKLHQVSWSQPVWQETSGEQGQVSSRLDCNSYEKNFNAHWQHRVCQNTLLPRRRPGDLWELKSAAFLWQFFCYWESDHTHVPWKMRLNIYQNTRREETIVLIPREQTAARWWFRNSPLPPFRLPHTDLRPSRCCMACHTGRMGKENHDFEPKPV